VPSFYTLWCTLVQNGLMGWTNIDIDDELVTLVMRRYNLTTKREAVDLALRELAGRALTAEESLRLEGSGWEGDLELLRTSRPRAI
jgi:Arc/MetJ family transcription regulator